MVTIVTFLRTEFSPEKCPRPYPRVLSPSCSKSELLIQPWGSINKLSCPPLQISAAPFLSQYIAWIGRPCKSIKMRFQLTIFLAAASATCAIASPTWAALEEWAKGPQGQSAPEHTSTRPSVSCHPHHPSKPLPSPPPRNKVCHVRSHNDGVTDDSKYILDALHRCNNGGHVVFSEGKKYTIGTALDLTFLEHIDIGMCHALSIE